MTNPSGRPVALLLLALCLAWPAAAQDRLLSPSEFLGYDLGTRFTPHHRVVAYVEHVAAHAPTVRAERYGETPEGRPLVLAVVASPERAARLEQVRTDHLKRLGVLDGAPASEDAPAIVWLGYNVHGNEASSSEAALATLYALADPERTREQAWLDDVVVVLDPAMNPDGRDRYVHWYTQTAGRTPDPDPAAREHDEPWPGGRVNHYLFDLNRDWAWATQPETQARLAQYNRWLPHVHVDFHEQGIDAPYYFAPAAEPFHDAVTDWQRTFQTDLGRRHAALFDAEGWLYFTRERFDLFYPGYGDTWPTFNGAVGMTYEQAGHGRAGLAVETAEGDTLTLHDRLTHHTATGLSTVAEAAEQRAALVEAMAAFYDAEAGEAAGPYAAYVIKPSGDPAALSALAAHLDRQGLRYGYAARARTVRGVDYDAHAPTRVAVEPGDLVVTARQPKATLLRVLMEPEAALADSLTYDITAWALPYVYGLEAYALTEPLQPDAAAAPARAAASLPERPYAYLARWTDPSDARFLAALHREGVRLRSTTTPFELDGAAYDAGTLVVTRRGNEALGDRFDALVRDAAAATGQRLAAARTGFVDAGPDFGSPDVAYLEAPRVAVLSGAPVSAYALGEVWHFFEQQLGYPLTQLAADGLARHDLSAFDVLVLPNGRYGRVLTDDALDALRSWVRQGGRLVALEGAAAALAGHDGFALEPTETDSADADSAAADRRWADRARHAAAEAVPGAVFRVDLDPTHPLAFGYGDAYYTLKRGDAAYAPLAGDDGWTVGRLGDDALVSGFAGHVAQERLRGTLVFGTQRMGRGTVVYLVDNPLFRGFWHGGQLLFANAVFR